jgi:pimeloyl-ACP methyl ester carboxylesterase
MGRSSFQPARRLLDWPDDVAQLADALDLDRFAVAGVSGGGPHALACAYALPDRVILAASLSGAGPIEGAGSLGGMHAGNRMIFQLAMRAPWLLQAFMVPSLFLAQRFPDRYASVALKGLPEADQRVLADPRIRQALKDGAREAVAAGPKGVLHEVRIFVQPWGFTAADIKVPVLIWQGTADRNVPVGMAQRLAAKIPDATLEIYDGEGHMLFISHWAEISEAITARIRAAAGS